MAETANQREGRVSTILTLLIQLATQVRLSQVVNQELVVQVVVQLLFHQPITRLQQMPLLKKSYLML